MKFEVIKDDLYQERVKLLEGMLLHSEFNKDLVKRLLLKTFPSEPESIRSYRESVFLPITKTYFDKILFTLTRIFNSPEFSINTEPARLKEYLNKPLGAGNSLNSLIYNEGVKNVLQDANGLFLLLPYSAWAEIYNITGGYLKDCDIDVRFYNSYEIYYKKEYIALKDNEGYILIIDNKVYAGVDEFKLVYEFNPEYPCVIESTGVFLAPFLRESFVSGVCPYWTQALIEFSDKQGALKHHLYPEKWRIESGVCNNCSGTGVTTHLKPDGSKSTEVCSTCGGNGHTPSGVYSEMVITKDLLSGDIKPPFMGYVEKDIEALEFVSNDIQQNIYNGFAAINMEFLAKAPMNQSGIAKEWDKNDTVHFIKTFSISYFKNVIEGLIRSFFYYVELQNFETGAESFLFTKEINSEGLVEIRSKPITVNCIVPSKIDFISGSYEESLLKVISSTGSIPLKRQMEMKLARKEGAAFAELCLELDELFGYSFDEKIKLLERGAITKKQFDISIRIEYFVSRALQAFGKNFMKKDFLTKLNILYNIYEGSI